MLDRGYLHGLIAVGSALEIVGLLAVSFSKRYWQILLAQGALVGAGCGLVGLLPVAVISMYFEEKRMLAVGLAATGASFGMIDPFTATTIRLANTPLSRHCSACYPQVPL